MKCEKCGNEIDPNSGRSKYCSDKCGDKALYLKKREKYIKNAKEWYQKNYSKAREHNRKAVDKYLSIEENRQKKRDYQNKLNDKKPKSCKIYVKV